MAENSGGETGDDTAPEADRELGRMTQVGAFLFRHGAERQFVAELVHRELSDRIGALSDSFLV